MKNILSLLLLLPVCLCHAQTERVLSFSKGDKFEKKTVITSLCQLQQGTRVLDISSNAAITKLYTVNDVTAGGMNFNIATSSIVDTINSMGKQAVYRSGDEDKSSIIQNAFNNIVSAPVNVTVNSNGIIAAADNAAGNKDNNVILSYSGVQPQAYKAGDELDLAARFTAGNAYAKGYSWKDSAESNGVKTVMAYTVQDATDAFTTIQFDGTITENLYSTNINGVLTVDNVTGIIVQKLSQTASTGYNMVDGIAYTEIRRTTLAEYCFKK